MVCLADLLLEVAIEHVDCDAIVLQVLDPFPIDRRVWILYPNPHFFDSRQHDPFGTTQFRVLTRSWSAGLQRGEQHAPVKLPVAALPLKRGRSAGRADLAGDVICRVVTLVAWAGRQSLRSDPAFAPSGLARRQAAPIPQAPESVTNAHPNGESATIRQAKGGGPERVSTLWVAGQAPQAGQERRSRFLPLDYLTSSLSVFRGRALTVLRAGLALTTMSSPGLNGLGTLRSLVASFLTSLSLSKPGKRECARALLSQFFLDQCGQRIKHLGDLLAGELGHRGDFLDDSSLRQRFRLRLRGFVLSHCFPPQEIGHFVKHERLQHEGG